MREVSLCWRAAEKERLSGHFVGAVSSQMHLSFGAKGRRKPCPLAGLPSRLGIVIPTVCAVSVLWAQLYPKLPLEFAVSHVFAFLTAFIAISGTPPAAA